MTYKFDDNKIRDWETNHIKEMKPSIDLLIKHLKEHNIEFSPKDGNLENVVFTRGGDVFKIAWRCFYRFSGLVYAQKGNIKDKSKKQSKDTTELIYVTDDMFINLYMKSIIDKHFNII